MMAADAAVGLAALAFRTLADDRNALLEQAVRRVEHAYGTDHPEAGSQRVILADAVLEAGDVTTARRLYEHADTVLGAISLAYYDRVALLDGLAAAADKLGDADARAIYASAANDLDAVGAHATWVSLTVHQRLAQRNLEQGDFDDALVVAREARESSTEGTDECTLCAELSRAIGDAHRGLLDHAAAVVAYDEAIAYATTQDLDPSWRAALLRDAALVEIQVQGHRDAAVAKAREALSLFEAEGETAATAALRTWLGKHAVPGK
jgi:tetratricopeptide (TPR) repeat protein